MLDRMFAAAFAALTLAATPSPPPHKFLAVDARRHRVTITLIASYDGTNNGFNFDGYSRFLMWTVPRGWTIHVVCKNRGPLRHSCAVVHGPDSAKPAFRGDVPLSTAACLRVRALRRSSHKPSQLQEYFFLNLTSLLSSNNACWSRNTPLGNQH